MPMFAKISNSSATNMRDARFASRVASTQQDAKDAAAALVDAQKRVASVESDNKRLMEQVSPVDDAFPVW